MAAPRKSSQKTSAVFRWSRFVNIFTATFVARGCAVLSVIGFVYAVGIGLHFRDENRTLVDQGLQGARTLVDEGHAQIEAAVTKWPRTS